jgi:hypothetical protein
MTESPILVQSRFAAWREIARLTAILKAAEARYDLVLAGIIILRLAELRRPDCHG